MSLSLGLETSDFCFWLLQNIFVLFNLKLKKKKKHSNLVCLLDERNDPALFKQQNRELEFADPPLTKEGWLWLSDMKNMKWSFLGSLYSKSLG